jgi:hypothetical protein
MKRGHVTGKRVKKPGAGDWYRAREEELIRQVERAQCGEWRPEESAVSLHGRGEGAAGQRVRDLARAQEGV